MASTDLSKQRRRGKIIGRAKLWTALYLLVLPTTLSLLVFSYYPKFDVVVKSFYRWSPPTVLEFIGFGNFAEAFNDPQFWYSFQLVGILLVANLLKLWPGIFAGIALHRIANDRTRYIFQVLFVVPMIIPAMVWLLIWKNFYDPDFGLVNRFLNLTGGMEVLAWLDGAMPALSNALQPFFQGVIHPLFGNVGGLVLFGGMVATAALRKELLRSRWADYALLLGGGAVLAAAVGSQLMTAGGLLALGLALIAWMWLLARRFGTVWITWCFLVLGGLFVWYGELWRLPLYLLAALGIAELVRTRLDYFLARPILFKAAAACILGGFALVLLGQVWTEPVGQFELGKPAWLGNENLVIPAIIFWGFPWVGTVGVLIYLSGLQNISQDVYEAAKLDGVGPLGMIFRIELPLIMTQVRINLIFITINTLVAYEIFLILLGPDGGPGGKGMVPGLYMFQSAFTENRYGYACALGMVLFVIILLLTIIYQRYVKVDK